MQTTEFARPDEEWRISPIYSIAQAAGLADVAPATVRNWLFGYNQPGHRMRPVFDDRDENDRYLSFLEVAEIVVASGFRRRGVTLERVRRARYYASETLKVEYPFATVEFKTDGLHIIKEFQDREIGPSLLIADAQGQTAFPWLVIESLQNFDWLDHWACRWFPIGHDVPIVVDPQMAAGRPTIEDTGITIETVMRRFTKGKQSPTFIADDYELQENEVVDIIRYATENRHLLAA